MDVGFGSSYREFRKPSVREIGIPLETFFSFVISVNNVARIGSVHSVIKLL